jgi:hypothetical protein
VGLSEMIGAREIGLWIRKAGTEERGKISEGRKEGMKQRNTEGEEGSI